MKRSLAMMLMAALILGLTGCGSIAQPELAEQTADVQKIELSDDEKEWEYGPKEEQWEAAGEIMLWSPDTLVLFYESFPNSYGGYVQDTSGLARALGTGNMTVTFRKA